MQRRRDGVLCWLGWVCMGAASPRDFGQKKTRRDDFRGQSPARAKIMIEQIFVDAKRGGAGVKRGGGEGRGP